MRLSRTLSFRLPRGVEVYSVSYGSETSLSFSVRRSGNEQRMVVRLPDPLIGSSRRAVIVDAVAPTRLKGPWTLPTIEPHSVLFLGGKLHLQVEQPLELNSYSSSGLRQTAFSRSAAGESVSFFQQVQGSKLQITTSLPEVRASCKTVAAVSVKGGKRRYSGELTWSSPARNRTRGALYSCAGLECFLRPHAYG